ncbi:FAD:protein FMN transferase [Sphingomonas sp. H39-1-10]|uniref:FAD:protein FMN transferase n=1 Tax=Sphingomonas pollutisoli TaxID=3030829 RepID=UPI0023BA38D8|nr:FAD:protein FMN transferase [Sphingomonas pollutisoli]MDF0488258.1 FAD:protein FMN transferase [Sphingomonas pollutisoli]
MRLAIPRDLDARAIAGVDRAARVADLAGETMGTVWRARCAVPAAYDVTALRMAIVRRLTGIVREMSHWEPESALSRFNRAPAGTWARLPQDFATVIAAGFDIAERSGSAFDPAIGRLVDLWGFGSRPHARVPSDAEIAAALAVSGWRGIAHDRAGWLHQPGGVALDLSGIAKGYAVDAVARLLWEQDVVHALVEIGGECRGMGVRPDLDPWWVDIETPPGAELAPLRVALHGLAVATSGDYVRGPHTLDPRTGHPARAVTSLSVLHPSAMIADAWASALTVLGPAAGAALAEREGLAVRCVYRAEGGAREWLSPVLRAMLA